jgi:hypothetical protein
MGIASSLLGTVKKKKNEYDANKNYASQIDRTNKWSDELESLYGQISGREKFSYDMNNDAFYNQYAQQYANNAKLAMEDTVGQVSALTGGYGNSYAATAGQAMYNQQMEGLNDRATELYQLALQQYNAEGDRLANLYSMTANAYGMEQDRINSEIAEAQWNAEFDEAQRQYNINMAYNASRALVGDAQWAAGYAFDVGRSAVSDAQWEKSFNYNADRNKVADEQWQKTFDYNAERDKVSDSQWQQSFDYQKERDNVSDSQFAQEMAYKYAALNKSGSGGSNTKTISKAEYERTIEALPNDLRMYLKTGATQVNNSDEVRSRRVTALKAAVEREENAISEETAKKLLAYWGYDY